jgi:signal transduction histidine kinase
MFFSLLDRFGRGPAAAVRLAALVGLIFWQFQASDPAGFHGRHLVLTVLLAGASLAWLTWAWDYDDQISVIHRQLRWDVYLMSLCGGVMLGISQDGPSNVFVFVAAFSAGARVAMPKALLPTGLGIVAVCVSWVIYNQHGVGELAYGLGILATAFAGAQRHDSTLRREQAELLLAQSQRSHEEALRAAKLEESSRIAREIHDVLAHSLAGLTIQLEATAALIESGADSDTILPRVRHAHELAREGLRETRMAVGALRGDGAPVVPAASRIEALVSDFRATGREITLTINGSREALAGPHGDAGVRIIQEALTNVTKHAPGAHVTVLVGAGPPLTLTVANTDPGGVTVPPSSLAASGGGYGIAGMRERVEEQGGSFSAGPIDGGWLVSAELPGEVPAQDGAS